MTLTAYSPKRNRVYVRKFDHDEARRRHEAGERIADLAAAYGVSVNAIRYVVFPAEHARMADRATRYAMSGVCVDCGANCALYRKGEGRHPEPRCHACAAKLKATSVRENDLQCSTCREWKPDDAFPRNKKDAHRRGRHGSCRACNTEMKRVYRESRRQPCSHGCGTLVNTVDRNDPDKPLECHPCAIRRIHAERKAA